MSAKDLSGFIQNKMKEKGITQQRIADEIYVTKQAVYNWFKRRRNIDWKIESLLRLSEVLEFELLISKGKLYIKENDEMTNKEVNLMLNEKEDILEEVIVKNKKQDYTVYKNFGDFSIITLYVSNTSINDDIEASLLEGWLDCYNTKEECLKESNCNTVVEVYALLDNNALEVVEECTPSLYHDDIETYYYIFKAKPLEVLEDGYEVVGILNDFNKKVVKAYANINVYNNSAYVVDIYSDYTEGCPLGLILISIEETRVPRNYSWQENIKYIYSSLYNNYNYKRYFDKERNEIKAGHTIQKDILNDYIEEDFYSLYDSRYGHMDNYTVGDTLNIFSLGNGLGFRHEDKNYDLNSLKLLSWNII